MARRRYEDDDGRRIADMNVDGMPWYTRAGGPSAQEPVADGGAGDTPLPVAEEPKERQDERPILTKKETRSLMVNAVLAALLIGAVFAVAAALFILFCIYVWFR